MFIYTNTGTLLGQWTPRNVGRPEGVTVWGNDLWVVDPAGDRVYRFAGGALLRTGRVTPTSSFALNAGNLDAKDLVTDGTSIWVVNDTLTADRVFKYSVAGVLQGSWALSTSNPSPTGITLDPTNVSHLWTVDASTDRVYQYDAAAALVTGTQEPSISFPLVTGNGNPQGIADPFVPGESIGSELGGVVAQVENTLPAVLPKDVISAAVWGGPEAALRDGARAQPEPRKSDSRSDDSRVPAAVHRPRIDVAMGPVFIEMAALQPANRVRHEIVDRRPGAKDQRRPAGDDADDAASPS
jgi:hypothetical protein